MWIISESESFQGLYSSVWAVQTFKPFFCSTNSRLKSLRVKMKRDMKWNLQFIMKTEKKANFFKSLEHRPQAKAFLIDARQTEVRCFPFNCCSHGATTNFCLESVWYLESVGKSVWRFFYVFVGSSQSPPRSTLWGEVKWRLNFYQNFVSAKKVYDSVLDMLLNGKWR